MEVYGILCIIIALALYFWCAYTYKHKDELAAKEKIKDREYCLKTIRQEKYLTEPLPPYLFRRCQSCDLIASVILNQWREENNYTRDGKPKSEEEIVAAKDEKQKVDSGFYEEMHRF